METIWKMTCTNRRIKEANAKESETAEVNKYNTVSEDDNKSNYWLVYYSYFNTDMRITANRNKLLHRHYMFRSSGSSLGIKMHFYLF
jgi:hypothetical protein